MSLPPQKMREIVLQLLYSLEEGQCDPDAIIALLSQQLLVSKHYVTLALQRVRAIQGERSNIEAAIAEHSPSYTFERIHSVERNILRLGTFELFYDSTVPSKVAISEAMRLTRKFSTAAGAAFVNAVLDAIYQTSQGKLVNKELLKSSSEALFNEEETINTSFLDMEEQFAS